MIAYALGQITVVLLFLGVPAIAMLALHIFKRKSNGKKRDILGKVQIIVGTLMIVWYAFIAFALVSEWSNQGVQVTQQEKKTDEKQQIRDYLNGDCLSIIKEMDSDCSSLLNNVTDGNNISAAKLAANVQFGCETITSYGNVPESCSTLHGYIKNAAKQYSEAAGFLSKASATDDINSFTSLVNDATDCIKSAGSFLEAATDEVKDIAEKYDL